jgi:hypothetical protein
VKIAAALFVLAAAFAVCASRGVLELGASPPRVPAIAAGTGPAASLRPSKRRVAIGVHRQVERRPLGDYPEQGRP